MICQACGIEYPDGFALAVHRRVAHPAQWQAEQRAHMDALRAMQPDDWFQRGQRARTNGEPFPAIPDQRLTMEHREAFMRGYFAQQEADAEARRQREFPL